jgi:hypothetical protein
MSRSWRGPVSPEPRALGCAGWEWVGGTRRSIGFVVEEAGAWRAVNCSVVVLEAGLEGWLRDVCCEG